MKNGNKTTLWARVGVEIEVSPDTLARLKQGDLDALLSLLHGKTGKVTLSGETYFPDIPENEGLQELTFDL